MLNLSRINCVLSKQNYHNLTWSVLWNNAEINFARNYKISKLSSSNAGFCNLCRSTEAVVPLTQNLFSFYSKSGSFLSSRNFSKSNVMWSGMQSHQDKEKLKNYVFFGTIAVSVIFVLYMVNTMQYHQDYVHIESSDDKK